MMTEPEALSERELEVLRLVARGLTNDQIAHELIISTNTVKVHLRNIFAKLGVASRTEASLYAVRQGWVILEMSTSPEEEAPSPPEGEVAPPEPPAEVPAPRPTIHPWTRWLVAASLVILILSLAISVTGLPLRWLQPIVSPAPPTTVATIGWVERAGLSTPRSCMALVPFLGMLYAIGGEDSQGVSAAIERFDPGENSWTSLASKPTAVADVQGTVVGGHIYVPGGRDAQGQPIQTVEVYFIERNQWTIVAPLFRPLSAYALVALEGKIYLLGGWDGTQYRDEVLAYTVESDRWEVVGRLLYPCGFASAVVSDNRIILVGGVNADGPLDVILEYYPPLQTMTSLALAVPLGRTQAALSGDWLYVLADPGDSAVPQIWKHNLRTPDWQVATPPTDGLLSGAGLVGLGSDILLVGGKLEGEPLPRVLEFQAIYSTEPLPAAKP